MYEQMYTIEKYSTVNPVKDCWIPLALQDAAVLHTLLYCAYGHITIAHGRKESPAAVVHLKKSIQIMNGRLQSCSYQITDGDILVVSALAFSEVGRTITSHRVRRCTC